VSAQEIYALLFAAFAFVLGASIGSFLNVCIYRMPLGLSVNEPKRSFCPKCKYQIPWYSNLPLITWIAQRGKCSNCRAPISVRYVLVEAITGALFLATWWRVSAQGMWVAFFPLAVFVSLVVVATFIDFEHFIIPDEVTWGGAIAGIVFSTGLPALHHEAWGTLSGHLRSGGWSLLGAVSGFALLWLVSIAGKAAFGKKTLSHEKPEPFQWSCDGERAKLSVAGEEMWWDELFTSEKDVLVMDCQSLDFEGVTKHDFELRTRYEKLTLDGAEHDLNKVKSFSGVLRKITFTRDAMGFGDVKFIACIGAFLGWQAVLFTVMAASIVGAVVGLGTIALRHREWSAKIPFGPYLSFGALLWMFRGPELVAWYVSLTMPPL
jgi:leader peptidase (prepilin peptidase) / N-methyltransferase